MIIPALADYPAHLHIDLLPAYQRSGHGRKMIVTLLGALHDAGAPGAHLGVLAANTPARAFYHRVGFHELDVPGAAAVLRYLGRSTDPASWSKASRARRRSDRPRRT
jgi:GNAT superfamily N-acetyltransferase